jgi:hypothetical protein
MPSLGLRHGDLLLARGDGLDGRPRAQRTAIVSQTAAAMIQKDHVSCDQAERMCMHGSRPRARGLVVAPLDRVVSSTTRHVVKSKIWGGLRHRLHCCWTSMQSQSADDRWLRKSKIANGVFDEGDHAQYRQVPQVGVLCSAQAGAALRRK